MGCPSVPEDTPSGRGLVAPVHNNDVRMFLVVVGRVADHEWLAVRALVRQLLLNGPACPFGVIGPRDSSPFMFVEQAVGDRESPEFHRAKRCTQALA